jgi:hypothetical protein
VSRTDFILHSLGLHGSREQVALANIKIPNITWAAAFRRMQLSANVPVRGGRFARRSAANSATQCLDYFSAFGICLFSSCFLWRAFRLIPIIAATLINTEIRTIILSKLIASPAYRYFFYGKIGFALIQPSHRKGGGRLHRFGKQTPEAGPLLAMSGACRIIDS